MQRVLFINPFGIGDCLFTTPLISAIKYQWPDSYIGFWCNERVAEILKPNLKIDVVFPLSRGDIKRKYGKFTLASLQSWFNLYRQIRRNRFDITLDFSLDHRYGLMARFCSIKRRIGIDYNKRGRFLTERLEISGYTDKHIVEYYLKLLDFLEIKPSGVELELFIESAAKIWAEAFLSKNNLDSDTKLIGVCPGAGESWGKDAYFKRWEPEKFAAVCDILFKKNPKVKFLLFGNKQDEEVCQITYNSISNRLGVIKLFPDYSLTQFCALLSKCDILLTNDGGPLHLAVALGVKTVSIFGPVNDVVYGPYPKSDNHIVIKANFACQPCYENFRFSKCEQGRRCLSDISPEDVSRALERLL